MDHDMNERRDMNDGEATVSINPSDVSAPTTDETADVSSATPAEAVTDAEADSEDTAAANDTETEPAEDPGEQTVSASYEPKTEEKAQDDSTADSPTVTSFSSTMGAVPASTTLEPPTVYVRVPANGETEVPSAKPAKPAAPKKAVSMGTLIITAVICVILSAGMAFGAAMLVNRIASDDEKPATESAAPTTETDDKGNVVPPAPDAHPTVNPAPTSKPTTTVITQTVPGDNRTVGTYTDVANKVLGTVVEITTESVSSDSFFWGNYVTEGAGSGVIISKDGYIITNNHVVDGASNITVTLSSGEEFAALLIGTDSDSDIAVIKIEPSDTTPEFTAASMGTSDKLKVGEEVVAVGNPLGELGGTVTNGIISALSRDINIEGTEMTLIQTNAAVNPGNSGGGLFNLYGELIGIVNAKTTTTTSGTSVEGIGFAIPIDTAKKVSEELIEKGYVSGKVMLGITYIDVTNTYDAFRYGVYSLGMYVASYEYGDQLKSGDRIVAIDGNEVTYSSDVKSALKGKNVGDTVDVKVVRNGRYVDVEVTLQEYIPETAAQSSKD